MLIIKMLEIYSRGADEKINHWNSAHIMGHHWNSIFKMVQQ